jgi:hypothetical protein
MAGPAAASANINGPLNDLFLLVGGLLLLRERMA